MVALLALGRTQDQQRLTLQQQERTSNSDDGCPAGRRAECNGEQPSAKTVWRRIGEGASELSWRARNSNTRITVEEQFGKNLTLTYATDVDTTAQQLMQAEIAINRHISLLVTRDESDVFSMVVKATRRFSKAAGVAGEASDIGYISLPCLPCWPETRFKPPLASMAGILIRLSINNSESLQPYNFLSASLCKAGGGVRTLRDASKRTKRKAIAME